MGHNFTETRSQFASIWDRVVSTREPETITRRGSESLVLLPKAEFDALGKDSGNLRDQQINALSQLDSTGGYRFSSQFYDSLDDEWPL